MTTIQLYRARFAALRVALFQRWRGALLWRVRCGYRPSVRSSDLRGYCDDARRVIWISPGLVDDELDAVIVHEIVHAVAGPGHNRRFVARLRRAADAALGHGLAALAAALRAEAAAYESTPAMRAHDVYLEVEEAVWQGASLGAVAGGLGLTLAEMLHRYPRARRVYDRARSPAAQQRP